MTSAATAAGTARPGGPGGAPGGHYRFRGIARMEWVKLRSLRSIRWTALATAVIMIGLGMLVLHLAVARWGHMSRADQRIFDPVNNGFTGLALAQLAAAAIGVLAVTSEYSSGMIRATLAAAPGRVRLALAKAAVLAAAVLLIGEVVALVTFFASEAMLHAPVPRATLATPGALRAVVLAGAYLALIALIGMGAGLIIRHSAAAITTLCVVILLLPALTLPFSMSVQHATQKFLPEIIAENSLTAVKPIPYSLTPWMGLAVLMLYAAAVAGAGTWPAQGPAARRGVTSWSQALVLSVSGGLFVLAAPWMVRLVVLADRWLIRRLLTGRPLAERVRELQASRAQAVDASAATLRRVERDLHDGAQARLVTVAMQLGLAREKLSARRGERRRRRGRSGQGPGRRRAPWRQGALTELRDLARGIHPPALDHGLAEALATLAARSAVPATLTADVPVRPTAAIETIAYFCAAELLANVAKHSGASRAAVDVAVTRRGPGPGALRLSVTDDGSGGAVTRAGGGLAGLAQRVAVVDGTLTVCSPDGGPTVVTADLPLHA